MTAAKHTPGPWYANHGIDQMISPDTTVACLGNKPSRWHIFSSGSPVHGDEQADANLIAAAPELLHACQMLLRADVALNADIGQGDDFSHALDASISAAHVAIVKATGAA